MPKKTKKVAPKKAAPKIPECTSDTGHRTVALKQNEDGSFVVRCNECHLEWTADASDG